MGRHRNPVNSNCLPAIRQFIPDLLQVGIPHVADVKDEAVLVVGDAFADVLEEALFVLPSLLGHLRQMDDF